MTDNTELIEDLRRCLLDEPADALEQAQARIAELEADLSAMTQCAKNHDDARTKYLLRVSELEAERDAALASVDANWTTHQEVVAVRKQNTALALQVEQMLGNIKATEKCLTQDPCKENAANNALAFIRANYALSTAPASEIIAAHDAKVIERCAGVADDCAYGCGAAIAIRALIAAPKPGETKEVV